VPDGGDEDNHDANGDESLRQGEVTAAECADDCVLEDGEDADGFGLEECGHLDGEVLEPLAVLRGDADGVIEGLLAATDEADEKEDEGGEDGEEEETFGRSPGVGIAGQVEVGGDAAGKGIGPGEGVNGDFPEDAEGKDGDGDEEFTHGCISTRRSNLAALTRAGFYHRLEKRLKARIAERCKAIRH